MPLTTAFHRRYTVYSRRQRRQPKADAHAVVHVQRRPTSEAGGESVLPAGELPVPGGEHHHHHEQGRAGPARGLGRGRGDGHRKRRPGLCRWFSTKLVTTYLTKSYMIVIHSKSQGGWARVS